MRGFFDGLGAVAISICLVVIGAPRVALAYPLAGVRGFARWDRVPCHTDAECQGVLPPLRELLWILFSMAPATVLFVEMLEGYATRLLRQSRAVAVESQSASGGWASHCD